MRRGRSVTCLRLKSYGNYARNVLVKQFWREKVTTKRMRAAPAPEPMNVSDHTSLAQVQVYIDRANQRRLADGAMSKRKTAKTKAATRSYKPCDPELQTGG
jgi:hypothetical protein